jgi:DNA-binding NarL/FixJ family response regulator
MTSRAKIMLVDDHAIVRQGYRVLLEKQSGLQVVAEAGDGDDAYRLYQELSPDLVIMDLTLPQMGGMESIRRILRWDPQARILVFTMHHNAAYAVQAMRAGARGYITKTGTPQALVQAVFDVVEGKIALSADIDHELALSKIADAGSVIDELTPREFEILRMLLTGKSIDDIAGVLNLSRKTVANTHYLIKNKLGVTSDIALVLIALRYGIVSEVTA